MRLPRRAIAVLLVAAAVGLAIALAAVWSPGPSRQQLVSQDPPRDCPNFIPVRGEARGTDNVVMIESVRNGTYHVADLTYTYEERAGGGLGDEVLIPRAGSFRNASAPGGDANGVRYVDVAGAPDTVDPGDYLVFPVSNMTGPIFYDASGRMIGGGWGCV